MGESPLRSDARPLPQAVLTCIVPARSDKNRFWWRRRESNPDPKANAEGIYMLSRFSFRPAFTPFGFAER